MLVKFQSIRFFSCTTVFKLPYYLGFSADNFPCTVLLFIFEVFPCFYNFSFKILRSVPICHLHPLSAFHCSLRFPWNPKLPLVQRNLPIKKSQGTELFLYRKVRFCRGSLINGLTDYQDFWLSGHWNWWLNACLRHGKVLSKIWFCFLYVCSAAILFYNFEIIILKGSE